MVGHVGEKAQEEMPYLIVGQETACMVIVGPVVEFILLEPGHSQTFPGPGPAILDHHPFVGLG